MSSINNSKVISEAKPHTIKKFELIEEYIKSWAQILMLNSSCHCLVFIDCMCNSGVYTDSNGKIVFGTPIRVANALLDVAHTYTDKQVQLYLNDISEEKINELRKHLPCDERNFKICTSVKDGNELLEEIGPQLYGIEHKYQHFFLLYDPYDASINWKVLIPFLRTWGEVMINHMVSDPVRAISQVKRDEKKEKYENTYLTEFEKLIPYGNDKKALESRIESIINDLKGDRKYFVGAFPFYNTRNSQLYSLIHCTSNIKGFNLYKKTAWKIFEGQSSTKDTHRSQDQLFFNFLDDGFVVPETDESCFFVSDIAKYLQKTFSGQRNVPLESLWHALEYHPIFPSEGFSNEIKRELKDTYNASINIIKDSETGKRKTVVSFQKGNNHYE